MFLIQYFTILVEQNYDVITFFISLLHNNVKHQHAFK